MAGHSHASNVAVRKGKQDAKRAKAFAKMSKLIMVAARSNLVVFCHRGDAAHPQILTAERFDEIRIGTEASRLVKRTAILDSTVLGLESLSIFL